MRGSPREVDVRRTRERAALVRERDAPVAVVLHVELALLVDPALLHLEQVGEVGADQRSRPSRTRPPRRSSRSRCLRACRGRRSGGGTARDASRRGPRDGWPRSTNTAAERIGGGRGERLGRRAVERAAAARRRTACRGRTSPADRSGSISPDRLEMQNAEPSTSVTMPSARRRSRSRSSSTAAASR